MPLCVRLVCSARMLNCGKSKGGFGLRPSLAREEESVNEGSFHRNMLGAVVRLASMATVNRLDPPLRVATSVCLPPGLIIA